MRTVTMVIALIGAGAGIPAVAQPIVNTFEETFDGSFENPWGVFPFAGQNFNDFPFTLFDGFPDGVFTTIDGAGVYDMTNAVAQIEYVGMSPDTLVMDDNVEVIEARINTRTPGAAVGGGPITLRVLSPSGESATFGLYSGESPTDRRFRWGSTLIPVLATESFGWSDDTWYRLVINNQGPSADMIIRDDSGNELVRRSLGHRLGSLQIGGIGLYLAVIQDSFAVPAPVPRRAALDWVRVGAGCVGDLAAPFGVFTFADVSAFISAFQAGCP